MRSHESTEPRWKIHVLTVGLIAILGGTLPLRAADNPAGTNSSPTAQAAQRVPSDPGQTSDNNDRLRERLKQFPDADANKDGVLTLEEARAFKQKVANRQSSAIKPNGGTNSLVMVNPPTFANVKYGPHERNVLDFWKAKSDQPAPVVVFIHGGGFETGDKSMARKDPMLTDLLKAGVSFASINYRFREQAPVQDILHDAARAIQFIRYQAADWNVDKKRIAAYGGSAGAGTSLWLAAHDDLADPKNSDPVLRESSRLVAAGLFATQATYDLVRWEEFLGPFKDEWLRSPNEIADFYHLKTRTELNTPEGKRVRAECDMLHWLSKDDPPIYAYTSGQGGPSKNRGQHLHHPDHVREIQKRCKEVDVECVAILSDGGPVKADPRDEWVKFVKRQLGVGSAN